MENTDDADDHGLLLIPGDVLIQILVWLPVISLLRFKSVCKSWRELIESSFFIHLHDTTTTNTVTTSSSSCSSNKFGSFIFQISELRDTTETINFMLKSSRRFGGDNDNEVFEVEDLGVPPLCKTDLGWWKMVGSCNGIICLKLKSSFSLWNPATKQFRLLPKSSLTLEEEEEEEEEEEVVGGGNRILFGFGFEVKTKDYKVVQIRPMFSLHLHEEKLVEFGVEVYSLSSNSWRVFFFEVDSLFLPKPFQGSFHMSTDGIYLNGSFFFHGRIEEYRKPRHFWILSFDFTKEIFTPIKLFPDEQLVVDSNSTSLILTYFGADKIAFLVHYYSHSSSREERGDFVYDIWVLNEHEHDQEKEEEESYYYYWTKSQHSIRISTCDSSWTFPKVISGDGEFALIETRCGRDLKLQLFNLVTKEEKTVLPTGGGLLRSGVYKPSLVSIIGGGNGNGTAACSSSS